jgi:lysophospholipase L1-like esterase
MKSFNKILGFCFLALLLSSGIQAQTIISADDPNIAYVGRVSFANPQSPCFTYPGVQIRAQFTGKSIAMKMKPKSGWFEIEIDNQTPFKVSVLENDSIVTLAKNLNDGTHTVCITLVNEGYERRPEFRGFILDEGANLAGKPELPQRKIEFIGNSITCGYGMEGKNEKEHYKESTSNFYFTYAAITARTLNAQAWVVARSGIGIYRNYNGPRTGNKDCMPAMYDQTLFTDNTVKWDYSQFTPDVVVINLGTNDCSTPNYDTQLLTNAYLKFVQRVRSNYPNAKIVLLTGVMLHKKPAKDVKKAMNTVRSILRSNGDKNIFRFDCSEQKGDLGYGSDSHPSMRQHAKMASELIPFLKKITDWQ